MGTTIKAISVVQAEQKAAAELAANLPLTPVPKQKAANGFPNAEQAEVLRRYCKDAADELGKVMGILTGIIDYGVHTGSAETTAEISSSVLMSFDYALTQARNLSYLTGLVSGGNLFETQRFDLAQCLMDTYMLNERYLTHRQTLPSLLVDRSILSEVDPNAVHQMVSNLLTRSGRFVSPGGKVTLSLRQVDKDIEILFQETRSSLPLNVNDLDLAVVRIFAEAHGGTFSGSSEKGETKFVIRIPMKGDPNAENNLNKRRHRRARIQFPVDFRFTGQGIIHSHSINLSVQGVFIAYDKEKYATRPAVGQELALKIYISRERAIDVHKARVASVLGAGFGIEFGDTDDKTKKVLSALVKCRPY